MRSALSEATVAFLSYCAEIDVSGALLQALGADSAIVYDIGGLGEVVGRFGAGAVVEPGDVDAMTLALRRLLDDPDALATARRGAERAREELDLGRVRRVHLDLYREPHDVRDVRFGDLVERQLDLFAADESGPWTRRPSPTPRGPRAPGRNPRSASASIS